MAVLDPRQLNQRVITRSIDEVEQALREDAAAALDELGWCYAQLKDPLEARAFLLTAVEAMTRVGLPWDFATDVMLRRAGPDPSAER